jgi:hypothetical protein
LQYQENGGILDNAAYLKDPRSSVTAPVNLEAAIANVKNQTIFFYQRFYITGSYKSDSLHSNSKWNEVVSIIHSFKYDRNYRSYQDQLSFKHNDTLDRSFYRDIFIDSTMTHDSVYFKRYENTIQLAINTNQWLKVPAELRFGIKNQIDKFSYGIPVNSDSTGGKMNNYGRQIKDFINTAFVASLTNRFSRTIKWGASAESYYTGYKAGDFELSGDIEKSIWGNFILKLSGRLASTKPGYFINEYSSNHFEWNNNFDRQQSSSLRGGLYLKKYKFSIEGQADNLKNFIYFDASAKPSVAQNLFSVYSLTINKLIDWGIFHTDIRFTFQRSGNDSAISIPYFSGFNSTYLEFNLFKKVMKVQWGIDVFYNSAFYANAYMPVTGIFYSQNNTKISDYPYTNMFLNIKVKRLRFCIEYERINSFLNNDHGFFLPQYPYNPGILKYGLSWTFYD